MSEDRLLSALDKSEPVKTIREIRKGNRDEDKILRDFDFIFDLEKDYYESKKSVSAFNNSAFMLNMKVWEIKTKIYQSKNILI